MQGGPLSRDNSPVEGGAADFEQVADVLAALPGVDQLPGVADLLRREFRLAPKFNAPALRVLHSGAGSLADKAAFQFCQHINHLPHGAACRRLGVDCLRERTKFHGAFFQVAQHGYQVAQTAA